MKAERRANRANEPQKEGDDMEPIVMETALETVPGAPDPAEV